MKSMLALGAAPYVVTTAGVLMPVRSLCTPAADDGWVRVTVACYTPGRAKFYSSFHAKKMAADFYIGDHVALRGALADMVSVNDVLFGQITQVEKL
jgi:hypothetical protein